MPQYKKVFDAGLYSSGGGFTRVGVPTLRTPGSGGKQVAKSLRFRSANSAYLNRTFGTPTNADKWTFSVWVKKGAISANTTLFSANTNYYQITYDASTDTIQVGTSSNYTVTNAKYRDPSAWGHVIVTFDSSLSATLRCKIYFNGVECSYSSQGFQTNTVINSAIAHYIGRQGVNTNYFDGYLAEVNFIDGSALDPTSFGEYNSDNIWVPKAYSGSYGTNGFYLDFADTSSTAALGYDAAGSNDWTVNGISLTAGSTYDSMYDSPTDYDNSVYGAGNYCVINPLNSNATTLNNANLSFIGDTGTTYAKGGLGTIGVSTGKWYFESTITTVGSSFVGVAPFNSTGTGNLDIEGILNAYSYYSMTGNKYLGTGGGVTSSAYGNSYTTNDVIGVALDMDNGAIYFGKQTGGTGSMVWQNSSDPTSGSSKTGAAFTGISGTYTPAPCGYSNSAQSLNFGQRPFSATPPTGFKALNTKNITRPTDANMWFYGDTPDLVWIKNRSATANHSLTDTVRGVGLSLLSSATDAEKGDQDIAELNKFGMTLIGASSRTTASANNFVYWAWKANGSGSSNTSGTITSTVSANATAGFSVVTFTSGSPGTVGHGLGVAPSMIILKSRNNASGWSVYHSSIGNTGSLNLQTTAATNTSVDWWSNTSPTSSVFSIGANIINGWTWVGYCFAAVAGYSAFGSYTGNGSADGPFVYLGFRPRWILIKRTDAANDWVILDSSRNTYNSANSILWADLSDAEASGGSTTTIDFLSNGFKPRGIGGSINTSSGTYIYAAFAEYPFKIARAR